MFLNLLVALVSLCVALTSAQIRVTCIGDSITEGGGCVSESYTEDLQKILGEKYLVTNAGKSSQTMLKKGKCNTNPDEPPSNYGDCSYWNTEAWTTAQNSKPDIVTIMLGTNDAKAFNWEGVQQDTGNYMALDYVDMINTLRKLDPVPAIYVMVPPPLYAPYPFEMNATIINQIYPVLIRDIATVTQSKIIDVHSAFTESKNQNLTCDGCHPLHYANYLIADAISSAIQGKK